MLLHRLKDGRYCIAHCLRGQWDALTREREVRKIAEVDGRRVPIAVEQGPGSGGKESAESTHPQPRGLARHADRPSGDMLSASSLCRQVQGGNVLLVRGPWTQAFIDEHVSFPVDRTKDQVGAAAAGFNLLTLRTRPRPVVAPIKGLI